jgi:hypothetical protein
VKWRDVDWKRVEKNVFVRFVFEAEVRDRDIPIDCNKLQKLIYRASSRGEIHKMRLYKELLAQSYYATFLVVRRVTQDNQGKKTAGVDGIKNLPPICLLLGTLK